METQPIPPDPSASGNASGGASSGAHDFRQRADEIRHRAQDAVHQADVYVRENPLPTILVALAVGFAIGILVRGSEPTPRSRWDGVRDRLGDTEDSLRDLLESLGKKSRKAYKKSSNAIRDAVEEVADAVHPSEYADNLGSWFRNLWK